MRKLTTQEVQPDQPVPPHCPYFATEQLSPPEEVVVAPAEDLDVEVAEVRRVVLGETVVAPLPEPGT
jgi:hypothetical protein